MSAFADSSGVGIAFKEEDDLEVEVLLRAFPGVKAADETTCVKRNAEMYWNFIFFKVLTRASECRQVQVTAGGLKIIC